MRQYIYFIIFAMCTILNGVSQDIVLSKQDTIVKYDTDTTILPLELNSEKLNNYKNKPAFDYSENTKEENSWSKFTNWLGNLWSQFWNWVFGDSKNNSLVAFFLEVLPYLIIGGIITFIIWLFYKLNPGVRLFSSANKTEIYFSEDEEIIKRKDIKKLINKALENKNYRLAVRYYYLLLLKNLSEARHIEYEFDKTNNDYISEIKTKHLNKNFIKATTLYDYIWYGNFSVSETDFKKAQNIFNSLEQQINKSID